MTFSYSFFHHWPLSSQLMIPAIRLYARVILSFSRFATIYPKMCGIRRKQTKKNEKNIAKELIKKSFTFYEKVHIYTANANRVRGSKPSIFHSYLRYDVTFPYKWRNISLLEDGDVLTLEGTRGWWFVCEAFSLKSSFNNDLWMPTYWL